MKIPYILIRNHRAPERCDHVDSIMLNHPDKDFVVMNAVTPDRIETVVGENNIRLHPGSYHSAKLSCYLSHYLVYDFIVKNNLHQVVVLEDDFIFAENYDADFKDLLTEVPDDFTVVRMYHDPCIHLAPHKDKKYITFMSCMAGDVGSLISYNGAVIIRALMRSVKLPEPHDYEIVRNMIRFVPNDLLIYRTNLTTNYNSVKALINTLGSITIDRPGPLGSSIYSDKDYYIFSSMVHS